VPLQRKQHPFDQIASVVPVAMSRWKLVLGMMTVAESNRDGMQSELYQQ